MRKLFIIALFLLSTTLQLKAQPVGKIIFDEGHGQPFSISKEGDLHLGKFARVFKDAGFEVSTITEKITYDKIKEAKALVISGAFKELDKEETSAIFKFAEEGGRVLINLHIPHPLTDLLKQFEAESTKIPIADDSSPLKDKKVDFGVSDLSQHRIFKDLKRFFVYGSWGLKTQSTKIKVLAKSSSSSYLDFNRNGRLDNGEEKGPFALILEAEVGKGSFILIGDDTLFQNIFLTDYNLKLAENLAGYFKGE